MWIGGIINGFNKLTNLNIHVICLSGAEDKSPRKFEFQKVINLIGLTSGVVMGENLGPANIRLPVISNTVEAALIKLGLSVNQISLVITHSPYGDEHMHPHHSQACEEIYFWTSKFNIPFGCFSCIALPNSNLKPVLRSLKRSDSIQLLNYSWCKYGIIDQVIRLFDKRKWRYPFLYTQWQIDGRVKRKMIECYQSINLKELDTGYVTATSSIETLYLFECRGVKVIDQIISKFEVPGSKDYFIGAWTAVDYIKIISKKIRKKLLFEH